MRLKQNVRKYRLTSAVFGGSFLLVLGGMLWAYSTFRSVGQSLILHYTEFSGITKYGDLTSVMLLGLFGLVLLVVNFCLAIMLQDRERFLGKLLTGASLFMAILIFIALSAIISVN